MCIATPQHGAPSTDGAAAVVAAILQHALLAEVGRRVLVFVGVFLVLCRRACGCLLLGWYVGRNNGCHSAAVVGRQRMSLPGCMLGMFWSAGERCQRMRCLCTCYVLRAVC
jgi:hypothetical protein